MKRFDVQIDLRPLQWSDIERKVKGWADRKPFSVSFAYHDPWLIVQFWEDSKQAQQEKATRTLCTIIRREKIFAAEQRKRYAITNYWKP